MLEILKIDFFLFLMLFATSSITCFLITITKKYHISFSARLNLDQQIQSVHLLPSPRLGSLAILFSSIIFLVFGKRHEIDLVLSLFCSATFVFCAGFADDVKVAISPRLRLLAIILSSFGMVYFSGYFLTHVSTPILKPIFSVPTIAICFTVFAITGVSHSMNLVDGLNGLALGIVIVLASCLGCMATIVSDILVIYLCLFVITVSGAVLLFNFPFGRIFLGDGGAYSLGYLLAWTAIFLIYRNENISAWSILLCFFWPVTESLFSIYRRILKKTEITLSDDNHFHHLVLRFVRSNKIVANFQSSNLDISNPLATLLLLPCCGLPSILSVLFIFDSKISIFCLICFSSAYIFFYLFVLKKFHH